MTFDHPMKLHCSQTDGRAGLPGVVFDHPMKLHCSQTEVTTTALMVGFDHPMKLHCSQTSIFEPRHCMRVFSKMICLYLVYHT